MASWHARQPDIQHIYTHSSVECGNCPKICKIKCWINLLRNQNFIMRMKIKNIKSRRLTECQTECSRRRCHQLRSLTHEYCTHVWCIDNAYRVSASPRWQRRRRRHHIIRVPPSVAHMFWLFGLFVNTKLAPMHRQQWRGGATRAHLVNSDNLLMLCHNYIIHTHKTNSPWSGAISFSSCAVIRVCQRD